MIWKMIGSIAVVVGIVLFLRPSRPVFSIRIRKGRMLVRHGSIHPAFLRDCRNIVESSSVESGSIDGVSSADGIQLRLSSSLPAGVQQRLRNAFHFHG